MNEKAVISGKENRFIKPVTDNKGQIERITYEYLLAVYRSNPPLVGSRSLTGLEFVLVSSIAQLADRLSAL